MVKQRQSQDRKGVSLQCVDCKKRSRHQAVAKMKDEKLQWFQCPHCGDTILFDRWS